MGLVIHNTLSGEKEKVARPRGVLKLFVCGPTVYGPAHLGHARVEVFFDVAAQYLRESGFRLQYVQNITDVDDKIIERARNEGKTAQEVARASEKEYLADMKALRVTSVDRRARASDYMVEIRKQITRLIEKGFAYQTSRGVYFEVRKFPDYGKLSRQDLSAVRHGSRIEPDPEKKDPLDFALWKLDTGHWTLEAGSQRLDSSLQPPASSIPAWPSPWGKGRPGWHIEDTAITEKLLGRQYDIHGGGIDLQFPHHECEIAQAEALSGKKPFVKVWMHVGFVLAGDEKMSKSAGNGVTVRDFLAQHSVNILRFLLISSHYRSPLHYTEGLVRQSAAALTTIEDFLRQLDFVVIYGKGNGVGSRAMRASLNRALKDFTHAMDDDFNTPAALAVLFSLINQYQPKVWEFERGEAADLRTFLAKKCARFGIMFKVSPLPHAVRAFTREREALRDAGDFKKADVVRVKIQKMGYEVDDTPLGPYLKNVKLKAKNEK